MTPEDQRLFERGTGREAVVADLRRVIAHCGSVPETAECLEVSQSPLYAVLTGGPIGPKLLTALYGPAGCALPAEWAAEPPAEAEVVVADEGTPAVAVADVVAAIDDRTLAASAAVDRYARARAEETAAPVAAVGRDELRTMFAPPRLGPPPGPPDAQPAPCACPPDAPPPAPAPLDWRSLAVADLEARVELAHHHFDVATAAAIAAEERRDEALNRRDRLAFALATIREIQA